VIRGLVWLLSLAAWLWAASASAHPLAPIALSLVEQSDGSVTSTLKEPRIRPRGVAPVVRLPSCEVLEPAAIEQHDDALIRRQRLRCGSWVGATVGVDGLGGLNAIVRIEMADGRVHQLLLDAEQPTAVVPAAPSTFTVLAAHLRLGVEHLLGGLDHLLFVLGLCLLLRRPRAIVVALTAFTLGHSLTLAAAVLGLVAVPSGLVEVGIAASLVVVALELVRAPSEAPEEALPRKQPAAVIAGLFGLLHGFGFAGVLSQAGLPADDVPLALLGFNIGIELGQLMVVLLGFGAAHLLWRRWQPPRARWAAGYLIGGLAAMWIIERTVALAG
jgi:hydrogenase/urease accessory protein HupE